MPGNSQGNVLTYHNLSVYYKVLVMKLYDAEVRIEKHIHITEKNDGYTMYLLYTINKRHVTS